MKTAYGDPALDGLAAILLRDSCGCAECRDFGSGQRLGSIADLPADVSVLETRAAGNSVVVIFGPGLEDGYVGGQVGDAAQPLPAAEIPALGAPATVPQQDRGEPVQRGVAVGSFHGFPSVPDPLRPRNTNHRMFTGPMPPRTDPGADSTGLRR